ncbi:TVP38/TMEM64 family protein [Streptococcus caprae]|uniref:TVP38/TMEM64 family protein n=1 Tax=Streptococcus caprae TaxID=1640501 RepID=A0ABV8CWQ6_9STRE
MATRPQGSLLEKRFFCLMGLLSVLIVGFLVWKNWEKLGQMVVLFSHPEMLKERIGRPDALDFLLLLLLTEVMTAIPLLSSSVAAIVNGLVFGPWLGFVLNLMGMCLGNVLVLQILPHLGEGHAHRKSNHLMEDLKTIQNPFLGLMLGYMIPFIPTVLVNDLAVELKVSRQSLGLAMVLGLLPASLLYAFGGDAVMVGNFKRLGGVFWVILVALISYAIYEWKKKRRRKTNGFGCN